MQPVDRYQWADCVASEQGPRDPLTRFVLLALAMHMDPDGSNAWPSQRTLAMRTGWCRRTVQFHLKIGRGGRLGLRESEAPRPGKAGG